MGAIRIAIAPGLLVLARLYLRRRRSLADRPRRARPYSGGPMKLPTETRREQLFANGRNRDRDHPPAVKFFNPAGLGT